MDSLLKELLPLRLHNFMWETIKYKISEPLVSLLWHALHTWCIYFKLLISFSKYTCAYVFCLFVRWIIYSSPCKLYLTLSLQLSQLLYLYRNGILILWVYKVRYDKFLGMSHTVRHHHFINCSFLTFTTEFYT